MINNSVKKCVICNNEKCGEFITINDKKYHLCCIEQQQHNWNELKNYISEKLKERICDELYYEVFLDMNIKMQELEGNDETEN